MKVSAKNLARWAVLTAGIGCSGGLITVIFADAIALSTAVWEYFPSAVFLMPFAGLLIVYLYRVSDERNGKGVNLVIESMRSGKEIPASLAPVSFATTVLSHTVSASTGRIGAALQIGGSLAGFLAGKLKLSRSERKICVRAGMSACFSPLFGTPFAACLFALELPVAGAPDLTALPPCFFAALFSQALSSFCGIVPFRLTMAAVPPLHPKILAKAVLIGIFAALTGWLFCEVLRRGKEFCARVFPNPALRIVAVSIPFIFLTLLFPGREYNGVGVPLITLCFSNFSVPYYAFLMKILFTALAVSAGFRGGEIGPGLCVGSTMGYSAAALLNVPSGLGAAIGLAGIFAAITNCPLTALAFSLEIFGRDAFVYLVIAVLAGFFFSGGAGLYSSQEFAPWIQKIRHSSGLLL